MSKRVVTTPTTPDLLKGAEYVCVLTARIYANGLTIKGLELSHTDDTIYIDCGDVGHMSLDAEEVTLSTTCQRTQGLTDAEDCLAFLVALIKQLRTYA